MNIKTVLLVCFAFTFLNITVFGQAKDKIAKIVIDAGHGGSMPGAVGKLCKEKDINLKVALHLGRLISHNFDDVTVFYTRKTDETVEVYKRAEMANRRKADLFISIHCNAVDGRPHVTGIETFVMGVGKSEESMAIAKKENADILLEADHETNYSNFDPNSPEAYIVFSLYSSAYLHSSSIFASKVQKHLVTNTQMVDREVKQAGFLVLYKVAMPSILIELGFISNAEEEKFLMREDVQEVMAVSIYNAFVEYKNLMEGTERPFWSVPEITGLENSTEIFEVLAPPEIAEVSEIPSELPEATSELPIVHSLPQTQTLDTPQPQPLDTSHLLPLTSHLSPPTTEICFRIQFFASKENLYTTDRKFASLQEVKKINENGIWKYTSGNFETLAEAQAAIKNVKKEFPDAFIIAFHNERKISVQEALDLMR
ncbi:MAG: N-acetylmuramoyl-L-alanine amidase [Lentimicrobiaceae bacterium]|nr:N-acetylmuramoyl-L-alanine amidase [Lentimicrobiaceae bacterium]